MRRFVAAIALLALAGCGTSGEPRRDATPAGSAAVPTPAQGKPTPAQGNPAKPAQLPLGGTTIFPTYRVVAYYGTAGNGALGVLGEASPDKMLPKLRKAAAGFAGGRKVQVAYELIASVAQGKPGKDGDYSQMIDMAKIQGYVDQARRNHVLVILDLQPGSGNFLPQAERLERFLVQPHVGIALDPEWRMPKGKVPARPSAGSAPPR
jgi:hypothetical protein